MNKTRSAKIKVTGPGSQVDLVCHVHQGFFCLDKECVELKFSKLCRVEIFNPCVNGPLAETGVSERHF